MELKIPQILRKNKKRQLMKKPAINSFGKLGMLMSAASVIGVMTISTEINAQEQSVGLKEQKEVAVTIYNSDLALVKDVRHIPFKKGQTWLAFRDVSAQMRAETALMRSLSSAGSLVVHEQNFDFDLLTPEKMLEKFVGKNVNLVRMHPTTGAETVETATILSSQNGLVMRIGNRIEIGQPHHSRIVFDSVPSNLRDRPTLVMDIHSQKDDNQTVELSYLTGGLSWKADYVLELNPDESKLDMSAWITLTNTSGATYRNAKLQLVAGDVNRVQEEMNGGAQGKPMEVAEMADATPKMAQETLFEYHLYSLDKPTTIAENQTKQVALLSAAQVPVRKELVLDGSDHYYLEQAGVLGEKIKAETFIEFENTEKSKLGMPFPKGVMRVYKKDSAGNAQFIGEDNVEHTPKNETIRLKLGNAFDVSADKVQTQFKIIKLKSKQEVQKYTTVSESAYEFTIKNAKKEAVTVVVNEPIPGDWEMLSSNHTHLKAAIVGSRMATWKINVPAEGSTKLTYKIRTKY